MARQQPLILVSGREQQQPKTDTPYGAAYNPGFAAEDMGLLACNFDPAHTASGTAVGANGTVQVCRLRTDVDITISNLHIIVTTVASGGTTGQNFMALYDANRNLLQTTADQTTAWNSTGFKTAAITAQLVPAGRFFIAFFANATTTRPSFLRSVNTTAAQLNGSQASNFRFGTADTGRTTAMPAALAAGAAAGTGWWVGAS